MSSKELIVTVLFAAALWLLCLIWEYWQSIMLRLSEEKQPVAPQVPTSLQTVRILNEELDIFLLRLLLFLELSARRSCCVRMEEYTEESSENENFSRQFEQHRRTIITLERLISILAPMQKAFSLRYETAFLQRKTQQLAAENEIVNEEEFLAQIFEIVGEISNCRTAVRDVSWQADELRLESQRLESSLFLLQSETEEWEARVRNSWALSRESAH
jgi:hypothetical protein